MALCFILVKQQFSYLQRHIVLRVSNWHTIELKENGIICEVIETILSGGDNSVGVWVYVHLLFSKMNEELCYCMLKKSHEIISNISALNVP